MIYSFDVFDTLITRTTATPKGIFALMQNRIENEAMFFSIKEKMLASFFDIRVEAEEGARRIYTSDRKEEVSLSEIYMVIRRMVALSDSEVDRLIKLEIETEINNVVPIHENISKLLECVKNGDSVILLSDMYLSSSIIRQMLSGIHPVFEELPIYISSEYGRTKSSGHLYSIVYRLENQQGEKWIHIGDNEYADGIQAHKYSIISEKTDICKLTGKEQKLIAENENCLQYQLIIGAAKTARIGNDDKIYQMGTTIGGGLLIPYAEWIVKMCCLLDIEKVFFVARDGFILKAIFEILTRTLSKVEASYLYGSRKAWNIPPINENMEGDNLEESREKLERLKSLLMAYLKQEIGEELSRIGFVEAHGTGKTQDSLCNIIDEITNVDMNSFYYYLEGNMDNSKHNYYSYRGSSPEYAHVIEFFTRALHGQTVGYEKQGNRYIPILWDDENDALSEFGYDRYIDGVLRTTEQYADTVLINKIENVEDNGIARAYMDYLFNESFEMSDTLWCDIPFGNEMKNGYRIVRYAPELSEEMAKTIFEENNGDATNTDYCGYSLAHSLLRCDGAMKSYIDKCIKRNEKKNAISETKYEVNVSEIGKRVVLYGAGKVGECIYKQLMDSSNIICVAWVDGNNEGKSDIVKHPSSIVGMEFDQVIIAVKNRMDAEDIKWNLERLGVSNSKIYWADYSV